jgi:hypothetical protein
MERGAGVVDSTLYVPAVGTDGIVGRNPRSNASMEIVLAGPGGRLATAAAWATPVGCAAGGYDHVGAPALEQPVRTRVRPATTASRERVGRISTLLISSRRSSTNTYWSDVSL